MPISEISVDCDIFVTRVTNVTKAKNVTHCHLFITLKSVLCKKPETLKIHVKSGSLT